MLVEKKADDLLITTRWLHQYGLVHAPKLNGFMKITVQNQSRYHGSPLWSEFLAPTRESEPILRVEERAQIEAKYPTLVALIFGSNDVTLTDSDDETLPALSTPSPPPPIVTTQPE
jgi:hypothetical protein